MNATQRVVRDTALLGAALPVLAATHLADRGAIMPLSGASASGLVAVMLVATIAAGLVAVPVRRGEQVEVLTLLETAVVAGVLLLPARQALWLPVLAVVLICLAGRRNPVKSLFNAGNIAVSSALLVTAVHMISAPGQGLSLRTVLGLLVGLAAFTVVNLLNLARVLAAAQEIEARAVLADGWRLALLTLPGHLSIAGSAVLAASTAPALLPFAFIPAVALVFAFRARADGVEERARSSRLLSLSHALAVRSDPEDLLPTFLRLCRGAFDADVVIAVLEPTVAAAGTAPAQVIRADADGCQPSRPADARELDLLTLPAGEGGRVLEQELGSAGRGLVAPLEAEGRRLGVLVLIARRRRRQLGPRELVLLTPLASALAAALQGSEHLRSLTEATSNLQAVVDQSSDGILVLDGAGTVQLWSPAMTALTGHDDERAVGQPLAALVRTLGADGTACDPFQAGRVLLTPAAPEAVVELTLLRDDGDQRVLRLGHAGAFTDGVLTRDVVIVHDITRARQVERLKADFIATVSHELRTPLTPIKGYADLLRRKGDSLSPERRNEFLGVISDRCDHLARLVEDLLLASRISAAEGTAPAQVEMGREDLCNLVRRAAGDFGVEGQRVRLALADEAVEVACDPMRVIQVLGNLIGNALKYSSPGSPVEVLLGRDEHDAYVDVVDEGRGIPADQLERVFDKFHRVEDSMRMTTGGTGLGLYIARQLTTAMGGSVTCTSTLGVGSVFRLTLPRAHERPLEDPQAGPGGSTVQHVPEARPRPETVSVPARGGADDAWQGAAALG
ncbi:MAG: domain S-box protein [Frankiales bacterium]|jgi:PAS domain S-box-containing protein|nr:domain S-box protein [Frankiales bacterium]